MQLNDRRLFHDLARASPPNCVTANSDSARSTWGCFRSHRGSQLRTPDYLSVVMSDSRSNHAVAR